MEVIKKISDKYKITLSKKSLEALASILQRKEYQKDELILEQGQTSRYMYIIEQGMIRQFYYKDGRNITEHFSCDGEVASCLESLFLKEPALRRVSSGLYPVQGIIKQICGYQRSVAGHTGI